MKKSALVILGLFALIFSAKAQDEKFKALFMYNFTKYIEWPQAKQSGNFVIGVCGNASIVPELQEIANKKTVGSQKIEIKEIAASDDPSKLHILYVTADKTEAIDGFINKVKGKGVVIITDKPGLAEAKSGINYIKDSGRLKYEVSHKHLSEEGVKVSSQLAQLGNSVD